MKRMISSLSPGGAESASISLTKPHLYSRLASVAISVSEVGINALSVKTHGPTEQAPQASRGKARAAAAGAGGVGILEYESPAHDLVLEVDLGAVQVEIRLV